MLVEFTSLIMMHHTTIVKYQLVLRQGPIFLVNNVRRLTRENSKEPSSLLIFTVILLLLFAYLNVDLTRNFWGNLIDF